MKENIAFLVKLLLPENQIVGDNCCPDCGKQLKNGKEDHIS